VVLKDPETIARFLELFEETLKQVQPARTVTKRLHWREFQQIAGQITQLESEAIREKFSQDLYLQRQHIKSAFEHFLRSDKSLRPVGQSVWQEQLRPVHARSFPKGYSHLIIFNSARPSGSRNWSPPHRDVRQQDRLVDKANKERKIDDIPMRSTISRASSETGIGSTPSTRTPDRTSCSNASMTWSATTSTPGSKS
jgi:hypothetical protein